MYYYCKQIVFVKSGDILFRRRKGSEGFFLLKYKRARPHQCNSLIAPIRSYDDSKTLQM